ncbi:efflux transporter outer membrane subunit [Sphingobium sp. BYY-5]|uniref:efflux transporter outer membrane subunit n=1 Tax=Sphingobium sp. BYY-5 TaxID=2926400 RepID=UPI001FA6CE54|nr:efflux transporter outer membrane subunit [Sphingobium sp. BYY-5]MCI4591915.1 efflux transporter outer membrane subunit [Sphingobium sp. BYY-5]
MRKSILPLVAVFMAGGCAAGPDYHRPEPKAAASASFVTRDASFDSVTALPDQWWKLYDDPALDALVERALTANTDLRIAVANLAKARATLSEAKAGRLPSTDINAGVGYGDGMQGAGGAFTQDKAQWSQNGSLAVNWEVDLFGRVSRAVEAARADAQAVEAVRDAVRVTVAAETTRAYLDACSYAYALGVAQDSYRTSNDSLRLVTAQEKAGSVGKLDVERAAAAAATARAAIPGFEAQHQVALFELAALLGGTPADIPLAARQCATPPAPAAALPVGDGASLLRRRPDLRQAERQLAADTARIGVATASLYPKISLGGSGNFFRNDSVRGNDSLSFSVGPLLSWSFPNISVARARIRQAQAQGDVSLAAFDGRVVTALKEVEQALSNVAREQERMAALEEAEMRSDRAWRLADSRYRAGSIALLDVLVAQGALLDARAAHAASLQRLSSLRVDLFKALGGGWGENMAPSG